MTLSSFDNECSWPRRLLHLQNLQTCEWQPGNTYHGHRNPAYNALSYTWGRWQLHGSEKPEVGAIPIAGASWLIPRVDPSHFTVEQFAAVIADSAEPHPADTNVKRVDFIWLDIACIDQTNGSREKALEIGRQAKIFQGATRVFVWLTTLDKAFYASWGSDMETQFELMVSPKFHADHAAVDKKDWASKIEKLLKSLLADPWFSSLWTLQEAYLSTDAVIVPSDAAKHQMELFRLNFIGETLRSIKDALSYNEELTQIDDLFCLSGMIDQTGLCICLEQNLVALLSAAGKRTTIHEEDRVYGIMQVFDFKLGASAPGAGTGRHFGLEELNDQLGTALLHKDPILSQMHIFQKAVAPGKGWRIDRSSIAPRESKKFFHQRHDRLKVEICTKLSSQEVDGSVWGIFRGPVMPFRLFAQYLTRDWPNAWYWGGASVLLDCGILDECPEEYSRTSLNRACFLAKHTPEVIILLLGLQRGSEWQGKKGPRSAVGLLLHQLSDPHPGVLAAPRVWKRAGLFVWSIEPKRSEEEAIRTDSPYKLLAKRLDNLGSTMKNLPYLVGESPDWHHASGLFG